MESALGIAAIVVVAAVITTGWVALLFRFFDRRQRERREREHAQKLARHNILFIDRSHKSRLIREYGIRTPEGLHRR